jgi:hypothetical protein
MEMIKRINRQSLYLLIFIAVLSSFFDWKRAPISVLVGGALALANLKGIHWGVTGLINPESIEGAKGKLVFFSLIRLFAVFAVLAVLIYLKLVNIVAVLVGLTVVFLIILKEGFKESRGL